MSFRRKILLTVLAAAGFWMLVQFLQAPSDVGVGVRKEAQGVTGCASYPPALTIKEVRDYYDENNRKYFNNELPYVDLVFGEALSNDGIVNIALTRYYLDGRIETRIDPRLNPTVQQIRVSLIHEQVHIWFHDKKHKPNGKFDITDHGPGFDNMIRELAAKGALDGLI